MATHIHSYICRLCAVGRMCVRCSVNCRSVTSTSPLRALLVSTTDVQASAVAGCQVGARLPSLVRHSCAQHKWSAIECITTSDSTKSEAFHKTHQWQLTWKLHSFCGRFPLTCLLAYFGVTLNFGKSLLSCKQSSEMFYIPGKIRKK